MAYATTQEVVQTGGFYEGVYDKEAVGTGNGTTKLFTLDHNPVVNGSLVVYVNSVAQTETTHYTVNYITGEITFVTAPTDTYAVEATYWYFTIKIDSDVISDFITEADAWVDEYTGQKWETTTATSEKYDGNDTDTLFLRSDHNPIISLTALTIGTTSITTSYVYVYGDEGKLVLGDSAEESVFLDTDPQYITVSYTYGTATTPGRIKGLARTIAAIKGLIAVMGGTYDDVTSWTARDMAANVGEPWVNLARTAEKLEKQANAMLKNIRKRPSIY